MNLFGKIIGSVKSAFGLNETVKTVKSVTPAPSFVPPEQALPIRYRDTRKTGGAFGKSALVRAKQW